jgi:hypothetical protein
MEKLALLGCQQKHEIPYGMAEGHDPEKQGGNIVVGAEPLDIAIGLVPEGYRLDFFLAQVFQYLGYNWLSH